MKKKPSTVCPHLLGHLATFGSRSGLMRQNAHLSLRRIEWRRLLRNADVAKRALDVVGSLAHFIPFVPSPIANRCCR